MHFTDYFIHKPVLSLTLCIFILLVGGMALFHLPIRLMPKIDIPVIDITTLYQGASANVVEDAITNVLQDALAGIDGIDYLTSSSRSGQSNIQVHFELGESSILALNDVIQKIAVVRQNLPREADEPVIKKISADDKPISIIAFTSARLSPLAMNDYLERYIKPSLELIPGVAAAQVMGEHYAMRISLDPNRLVMHGLTPLDVANSLKNQNIISATGINKNRDTQTDLFADTELSTVNQFNHIVLRALPNHLVRLNDIGMATLGADSDKITTIVNGLPATMLFIQLLPEANPLWVAKKIKIILSQSKTFLPNTMTSNIIYDASRYINLAVTELSITIIMTFFIILVVIYCSLNCMRATLIPLVTIPLSLIGVCIFLWVFQCSLNVVTLLAMVLAIGLVVDDAIIMLENIYRYREQGASLDEAALQGAREMIAPLISMSLILSVVYLPLIVVNGITTKLSAEFALTLSLSVIISAVLAIILSPMMCATLLPQTRITLSVSEKIITYLKKKYLSLLAALLQQKKLKMILVIGFLILASVFLYSVVTKNLLPRENQGFLQVMGNAPNSTTTNYLQRYTQQLNTVYHHQAEIDRYVYINNIPDEHQFLSFITFKPTKHWQRLLNQLQEQINAITGIQATVIEPSPLPIDAGLPVEFVLKSSIDYKKLYDISEQIKHHALQSGKFLFLDQDVHFNTPQEVIEVDRAKAAHAGISIDTITQNLSLLFNENTLQTFTMLGKTYPVIVHASHDQINFNQIILRNNANQFIPLANLLKIKPALVVDSINQFQKTHAITLSGVMAPSHSVLEGLRILQDQLNSFTDSLITVDYMGESRIVLQENKNNILLFFGALVLMYLILSVLFENFYQPIIILFSCLPGAIFSGLFALYLTHASLTIYSELGLLTLMGLVTKHGIFITDFANKIIRKQSMTKIDAILYVSDMRFRPIFMTTAAMVLSALPLVFALGTGAESRFNLGIVMLAGILFGTIFALFFVPYFYCYKLNKEWCHVTHE